MAQKRRRKPKRVVARRRMDDESASTQEKDWNYNCNRNHNCNWHGVVEVELDQEDEYIPSDDQPQNGAADAGPTAEEDAKKLQRKNKQKLRL